MTGQMSDNPADSLRELEALQSKLASAITNTLFERDFQKAAPYVFHAVWPLITTALEAARADERERLILALGSLDGKNFMDAPHQYGSSGAHAWAAGHDAGVEAAAELIRSVGAEPKAKEQDGGNARSLYHAAAMAVLAQKDDGICGAGMAALMSRVGPYQMARIYNESLEDSPADVREFWKARDWKPRG